LVDWKTVARKNIVCGLAAVLIVGGSLGSGCKSRLERAEDDYQNAHPGVRAKAVDVVDAVEGDRALEFLLAALGDPDPKVVLRAVDRLGGRRDTRSITGLIGVLTNKDPSVRHVTADTMRKMGPAAVDILLANIDDKDLAKTAIIIDILGQIGDERAVMPLIEVLEKSNDYHVRTSAVKALGRIGDMRAVWPLIQAVKARGFDARYLIVEALVNIGQPAVAQLIEALQNKHTDVVCTAAQALFSIGDEQAAPHLIELIRRTDSDEVRIFLIRALGELKDERAAVLLVAALQDQISSVVRLAKEGLVKIGPSAVPPLVTALKTASAETVRVSSIHVLGQIKDRRALEPLIMALNDNSPQVRQAAATALGRLGGEEIIEPLIAVLKDNDPMVRHNAADALVMADSLAVPALIENLSHPDSGMRFLTANILIEIKSSAVGPLIDQLKNETSPAISMAAGILTQIGAPAVPELIAELEREDSKIRSQASDILIKIGSPAVNLLAVVLKGRNEFSKNAAADILGRIGDKEAIAPLVEALLDLTVCRKAAEALKALAWHPLYTPDKVHFLLAMGKTDDVVAEWETNQQILFVDLRSDDPAAVEYASIRLVELGGKQMIPRMIAVMKNDESRVMAMAFLNSEHAELRLAAQKWMKR
jgi:HEAT repeat protein